MPFALPRRPTTAVLLVLSVLVLTVRAEASGHGVCVVDELEVGRGGQFEAVAGGESADGVELKGFATASGAAGKGWSVHLFTPGGANSILLLTVGTGRPEPGKYKIVDYIGTDASPQPGQYVGTIALEGAILGATGFASVTGSFSIAASSAGAVSGCFEFRARGMNGDGAVNLEGKFAAKNQDG